VLSLNFYLYLFIEGNLRIKKTIDLNLDKDGTDKNKLFFHFKKSFQFIGNIIAKGKGNKKSAQTLT